MNKKQMKKEFFSLLYDWDCVGADDFPKELDKRMMKLYHDLENDFTEKEYDLIFEIWYA